MDIFANNPGLQHLVEKIFLLLDYGTLLDCRLVNQSWNTILENPTFWINLNIKLEDNIILKKRMTLCLIKMSKHGKFSFRPPLHMALACKTLPLVRFILENYEESCQGKCTLELLTLIQVAARKGHVEIVQLLSAFTDNPNALANGITAIHVAALVGHFEVMKILAALTDNHNVPDEDGWTPMHYVACKANIEMVNYLASFPGNVNAPDNIGNTPIHKAALGGHVEVVKILSNFSNNPNAPNDAGWTQYILLPIKDILKW